LGCKLSVLSLCDNVSHLNLYYTNLVLYVVHLYVKYKIGIDYSNSK